MAGSGERYGPLVHRSVHHGATLWLAGVLIFIAGMIIAQVGWNLHAGNPTYSLSQNYISDLGATQCGLHDSRQVCSPWNVVFNASVIILGLFLILGTFLLRTAFPARGTRTLGLGLLVIAGIGTLGVGLSPEDVNLNVHSISALLAFAAGNLALVVLGVAMFRDTRWQGYRAFSVLCGLVGFVALGLFVGQAYNAGGFWAYWGVGGIERTIVAPVLLWAILAAIHLLRIPAFAPHLVPKVPAAP